MFRRSSFVMLLIGVAVLTGLAANLNASVISENWDTGYTVDESVLNSPWVDGGKGTKLIHARSSTSMALSDGWCVCQGGGASDWGESSRPTSAASTDTGVVAIASFKPEVSGTSNDAIVALSPSATDPGGNRWRDGAAKGTVAMFWEPDWGVALYYTDSSGTLTQDYHAGVGTGTGTNYVQMRISVPKASGPSTASFDFKLASDSTWTNVGTLSVDSSFNAANLCLALTGVQWGDDISFSSTASPEPSSLVLVTSALLGLLAYAWRKRKCVPS
jgi:hypothetical protein